MYSDLAEIRTEKLQVLREMLFSHVGRRMLVAALHLFVWCFCTSPSLNVIQQHCLPPHQGKELFLHYMFFCQKLSRERCMYN